MKKRLFALAVAIMVMVASLSVSAATNSASGATTYTDIKVTVTNVTFNGSQQTAKVKVTAVAVGADGTYLGTVTLKTAQYTLSNAQKTNAGTYKVTVKGKNGVSFNKTVNWTINKKANPVYLTKSQYSKTYSKKYTRKVDLRGTVKNFKGSWTSSCASKYFTKTATGVWKIKAGTPKGTYTIKINVTGNKNHKAATKNIKVVVK